MIWFEETLYTAPEGQGYAQKFRVERIVHRRKTEFQDLVIMDTAYFGRVLALDGVVQTTERDEFVYHEMLVHVPMFAHGAAKRVLVIGGGDGGILREVLRHPVESATMVEIDPDVVDLCKEYLPGLSAGAFEDPRTRLLIDDGVRFMADSDESFDVIIIDSTDPIGPGEVLFTEAFYGDCKKRLNPGGILVTQNGVPNFQDEEVTNGYRRMRPHFADVGFFLAVVPTYVGGFMAMGWATDDPNLRLLTKDALAKRYAALGIETRYYAPGVHVGAFELPPFIAGLLK